MLHYISCIVCCNNLFVCCLPADFSSNLSSRLASSLSDLYAADTEKDRKTLYSSLPPPSSSSISLSSPSSSFTPPSVSRYGNGPRSIQHEVNNNISLYSSPAVPPTGKGLVQPGPQDFRPYRGPGPYSATKGPSGRYLSRSIPVSPLTQQQLGPSLCVAWLSVFMSLTHWMQQQISLSHLSSNSQGCKMNRLWLVNFSHDITRLMTCYTK